MTQIETYRKEVKIFKNRFISCYLYFMNPGGVEKSHYHDGIELELVIKGSSRTHKLGHVYLRHTGEIHEGVNDSKGELVFLTITIPAETESNTHYLK